MLKEEEKLLREESAVLKGTKNLKISDTKADSSMLSGFDTAEDTDIVFKWNNSSYQKLHTRHKEWKFLL